MRAIAIVEARITTEGERIENGDRKGPVYPPAGSVVIAYASGESQLLSATEFAGRFQPVDESGPDIATLQAENQKLRDEIALLKLAAEDDDEDSEPLDDDSDDADDDEDEEE